jgi:predicted RNA-binding protein YlqC (UPF0109 family)
MKDLVEYVVRALAEQPQAVRVYERRGPEGIVYQIEAAPEDKGKIIGRQGRVIESLRTVVRSFSRTKVNIEVR